ncbi:MAG: dienelactone hydrolase family protein [Nocardioidaceae bacterium]
MQDSFEAGYVTLAGNDGDEIEAYAAVRADSSPTGGVVVIHHMPGFDRASKEITCRFAAMGYSAVCPNLYHRVAPGADPDDAAAAARAAGGVSDEQLVGDVSGARDHLRALPSSNGKVGVIGHCSGGRQSMLAACSLPMDAAVDCYGAFVLSSPPAEHPLSIGPITDLLPKLACPVLGLFGEEDKYPSPDEVAELDTLLTAQGTPHDFHSFEGAGHAFFAVDRPSYRPAAAVEGWGYIRDFLAQHLAADASS